MDKETEKWYNDQFEMFSTQGWKDFVNKIDEMFEVYNEVESVPDSDHLFRRKGILEMLRWASGWQEMVERTHKDLLAE